MAHKIRERSGPGVWYPSQPFALPCPTDVVETVDEPESGYPDSVLYEMEAAGFYPTALRFSTSELVQVVKVVSDNSAADLGALDRQNAERLVDRALPVLDSLLTRLRDLAGSQPWVPIDNARLERVAGSAHFTVSQRRQLERLFARWSALIPESTPPDNELVALGDARQVLAALRQELAAHSLKLEAGS